MIIWEWVTVVGDSERVEKKGWETLPTYALQRSILFSYRRFVPVYSLQKTHFLRHSAQKLAQHIVSLAQVFSRLAPKISNVLQNLGYCDGESLYFSTHPPCYLSQKDSTQGENVRTTLQRIGGRSQRLRNFVGRFLPPSLHNLWSYYRSNIANLL